MDEVDSISGAVNSKIFTMFSDHAAVLNTDQTAEIYKSDDWRIHQKNFFGVYLSRPAAASGLRIVLELGTWMPGQAETVSYSRKPREYGRVGDPAGSETTP